MFIRERKNPKTGAVYRSWEERFWCPVTKKVKSRYLGKADDDYERAIEKGLRAAQRAGEKSDAWQREHLGATAQELKEQEANEREWTPAEFLAETATSPQDARDESDKDAEDGGDRAAGER